MSASAAELAGADLSTQESDKLLVHSPAEIDAIRALRIPRFDERALAVAAENFEELIRLPLKPCAHAQWNENHQRIDAVVCEMFGFDEMFHSSEMFDFARENPQENIEDVNELRRRWCREPGVYGGKKEIVELLKKDGLLA